MEGDGLRTRGRADGQTETASERPRRFPRLPEAGTGLRLAALAERLADAFAREFDLGAGFPWAVVCLAAGAAFYVALPAEPALLVLVVATALVSGWAMVSRRRGRDARLAVAFAACLLGLTLAKLETDLVAAPRLDHERTVTVTGWITDSEATPRNGRRLQIRVAGMTAKGFDAAHIPERVTVTARGAGRDLPVGSGVSFLARLRPPDGPTLAGGYDFARRAWFEGRGASGFVLGKVTPAELGPAPLATRLVAPLASLRTAIADSVRAALPGTAGAIAAALMVGEARAIPDSANDVLRTSGLYHIISISGLHMSLVAGGVLVVARFLIALVPALALRRDARKIAAVIAVVAATFYLLLSGAGVATVRSWVMFVVALAAVLADRPAVTLHTVAVAATIVLLVTPSSVVEPGFLMSFLAVVGLVSTFDAWTRWRQEREWNAGATTRQAPGRAVRLLQAAGGWIGGAAVSSLVAGLATAPVVIAEFHRGAPYGVLANLAVLPVVSLLIMPMAVVAALLLPFGLHGLALQPMGWGIDIMLAVATWVSDLPGGDGLTGRTHAAMAPVAIAGILWLALWRGRIRWLGAAPIALALMLAPWGPRPDVIVADDARSVALRRADGHFSVIGAKENAFAVNTWLLADADPRDAKAPGLDAGWRCDAVGCAGLLPNPMTILGATRTLVAVVRDPRAFPEDCRSAVLIVTPLEAPDRCTETALVLDRSRLGAAGTVEITFADGPSGIRTALQRQRRPWDAGTATEKTWPVWPDAETASAKTPRSPVDPTERPDDADNGAQPNPDKDEDGDR